MISHPRSRARAEAPHFAAVTLTDVDALLGARELAKNMCRAMAFRAVVEQAKGILIQQHRLSADEAPPTAGRSLQRVTGSSATSPRAWLSPAKSTTEGTPMGKP
jgi:hypothetical protein